MNVTQTQTIQYAAVRAALTVRGARCLAKARAIRVAALALYAAFLLYVISYPTTVAGSYFIIAGLFVYFLWLYAEYVTTHLARTVAAHRRFICVRCCYQLASAADGTCPECGIVAPHQAHRRAWGKFKPVRAATMRERRRRLRDAKSRASGY